MPDHPNRSRHEPPPGVEKPQRFLPKLHYELIVCGLRGHELVGMEAAKIRAEDHDLAREAGGVRWYRCLRCDSWIPLPPPSHPERDHVIDPEHVEVPLRGRALRDKIVLRVIAVMRGLHFVVLAVLAVAVFLFASHRDDLRSSYLRLVHALQGTLAGPPSPDSGGILGELAKVFSYSHQKLLVTGVALSVYALIELTEMVGLWMLKRWAEYLTFVTVCSLLPLEIHELILRVTVLKILTLVVNLAVVAYLLYAKRLFGMRGGAAAEIEAREHDSSWAAIVRATPRTSVPPAP